ncbi:MAG: sigma-70 family RNA polymerase sigma factor [Cryobacterium sp.]|nr:sigma-70 family RNA polymerase sigma factor [Cryobacterium sp.]
MTPDLAAAFREKFAAEWPRVVGATLRAFGDVQLAEDSAQEAFLRAHLELESGRTIENLGAWATTSARRIAIDSLRRDDVLRAKLPLLAADQFADQTDTANGGSASRAGASVAGASGGAASGYGAYEFAENVEAENRRDLIVIACNPVLSEEQQIALALRIVCGIPTADIAEFFEVPEATVAARLTRARKAISSAGVPFRWPTDADRAERLGQVLTTVYGIYTLGHTAPRGRSVIDSRLSELALSLANTLVSDYPRDTEVLGLKALIVLGEARRPARIGPDGIPIALADADRSAWGHQRIREGLDLAARALPGGGRFALQAGIAGLHSSAARWEDTDWASIATLYHGLKRVWPAPVVHLGSIVAESHRSPESRDRAAIELRKLREGASADFRRRVSAAIADVEERRGRFVDAREAIADALAGERNEAIIEYFTRVEARLGARPADSAPPVEDSDERV